MNVVPLALMTQIMDQRINPLMQCKVTLSEPMKFLLSFTPSREMGDNTRQRKTL